MTRPGRFALFLPPEGEVIALDVAQGLAGALTIAFALGALRPALRERSQRGVLGAWLVALSLLGLDNLSDAFIRLDCRAADPGCTAAAATTTWHGLAHAIIGGMTALLSAAAPFALGWRMRRLQAWRDLATAMFVLGALATLALAAHVALSGGYGRGYAQRALLLVSSTGVLVLARRVEALAIAPANAHD